MRHLSDKDKLLAQTNEAFGELRAAIAGLGEDRMRCAVGFWGGGRPSLADYVTVTAATDGATAAGARSC